MRPALRRCAAVAARGKEEAALSLTRLRAGVQVAVLGAWDEAVRGGQWEHLMVPAVFSVVGSVLLGATQRTRLRSAHGVEQDVAAYASEWQLICADARERDGLRRVEELCLKLRAQQHSAEGRDPPRQRYWYKYPSSLLCRASVAAGSASDKRDG